MPTCQETVQLLEESLREQQAFIESMASAALVPATVVEIAEDGKSALVASGKTLTRVNPFDGAQLGSAVLTHPQSGQIVGLSPFVNVIGAQVTVESVASPTRCEVLAAGERRHVIYPPQLRDKLVAGAQALLDPSGYVLTEIVSAPKIERVEHTEVRWEQIGGNERAKTELQEAIALITGDGGTFKAYGAKPPKGVLLYGPPGCGKTMLGKAVATQLGSEAFMYVKAPEILNPYVGMAEEKVRTLFRTAREHKARTGRTAVLFIDEADAILQQRGSGLSADMEKTIVPSFLTEMDGMADSAALVILATNRADTLDPAVIREGRIDSKILIERPGQKEVRDIFAINLLTLPISKDTTVGQLADHGTEQLLAHRDHKHNLSGALVAATVERAKRMALRRDLSSKTLTGISIADITTAISEGA